MDESTALRVAYPAEHGQAVPQRTLVISAAHGDQDAFASLVDASIDRLFGVAHRILRDWYAADDAVQETFVAAWRDLRGLRDPDRFDAWLYRILVRICHRQAVAARQGPRRVEDDDAATAPSVTDRVADRDQLERAYERLTRDQRSLLVLRFHVGLTHAELADVLSIPEGTVASRLHYATKALRAAVDADARTTGSDR